MKRRFFLKSVPLAGLSLTLPGLTLADEGNRGKNENETILLKVKNAMLCMQRATWEQGVAMQALLEHGDNELVILMARDAVLRQAPDGRLAMLGEEFALSDAASPGEAVLWAAKKTNDQTLMNGFLKMLDYILTKAPRDKNGIIYHFSNIPQIWSDIMYMLPPFLAAAGKYDEAVKQIAGPYSYLWDEKKRLLSHMWDCEKNAFVSKDFWGVGNGWTAAGISRVIKALPDSKLDEKKRLIVYLKNLLDGVLSYIREDGLFHNTLDKSDSFVETNLSQMLTYSIYRGIEGGWLERNYATVAEKMRSAVHSKVDQYGLVQGVCGSPEFDHPGTATEGQAFFILMETAYRDCKNKLK
jgi:rhamnogalacturonyl hydrolase YesR